MRFGWVEQGQEINIRSRRADTSTASCSWDPPDSNPVPIYVVGASVLDFDLTSEVAPSLYGKPSNYYYIFLVEIP